MRCNVGKKERTMRVVIGVFMILIGLYLRNWWGLIGLVLIITGLIRFCPAKCMLGMKDCKR